MLAVYRRLRDLCWEVLAAGDVVAPSRLLVAARVRPETAGGDRPRIPASGPVLVAADGTSGVVESLAAAVLLRRVRPDVKVLASQLIARRPNLEEFFIAYDRWQTRPAAPLNLRAAFAALDHFRSGGLLAVFPEDERPQPVGADGVAEHQCWVAAVRMALLAGAAIIPVSFTRSKAAVSVLPGDGGCAESAIEMRAGAPLDPRRLASFSSVAEAGSYVRWRTTLLAGASSATGPACPY
jgi:hypothetical protein